MSIQQQIDIASLKRVTEEIVKALDEQKELIARVAELERRINELPTRTLRLKHGKNDA